MRTIVVPTDYFLPNEFEQVVAATDKYEYGGGNDNKHRRQRLRALTLLMRWSGLAIPRRHLTRTGAAVKE